MSASVEVGSQSVDSYEASAGGEVIVGLRELARTLRDVRVRYDAAVFTLGGFVPADLPVERVEIIAPAIDPQSPKNLELDSVLMDRVLGWNGVDTTRPLVTRSRASTRGRIRSG